jgi:serine protease SohB
LEFLFEYGLFLAKTVTFVVAVGVILLFILGLGQRNRRQEGGHIEIMNLGEGLAQVTSALKQAILDPELLKQEAKAEKKRLKAEQKARKKAPVPETPESRAFVIDFEGDIQASAVSNLREEITAVLSLAESTDEVIVRPESPGGVVHGYGLAASQLQRIVRAELRLTVAVDKVAASGGYMMACIANHIVAAPFALVGSIGVLAQVPNFHRLLKKYDVDVDVLTAGEYKRTLTTFGENTDKGREKFIEELEDVHSLFKDFVVENRPQVDIEQVSTGEAWYGKRAIDIKLVDELVTSDELLVEKCKSGSVFQVKFVEHKSKVDRVLDRFGSGLRRAFAPVQSF